MTILRQGKNVGKKLRGTCPSCGCVIQCYRFETRCIEETPGDVPKRVATCPCCGFAYLLVK